MIIDKNHTYIFLLMGEKFFIAPVLLFHMDYPSED